MLSVCGEDGAAHEVINGDRLVLGTLNGDAEMLCEDEVASMFFGRVYSEGGLEVGYEDCVLSELDVSRVISVAIVPGGEGIVRVRDGHDVYGCVGRVGAFSGDASVFFVIGDEAEVDMGIIDGAAYEADIVAIVDTGAVVGCGVHVDAQIIVIGCVVDGHVMGIGGIGIETFARAGGSLRTVEEGDNEVARAIVGERRIKDDFVPTAFEMKRARVDLGEFASRNQSERVVEKRLCGVGEVYGARCAVESRGVGVVKVEGADVL